MGGGDLEVRVQEESVFHGGLLYIRRFSQDQSSVDRLPYEVMHLPNMEIVEAIMIVGSLGGELTIIHPTPEIRPRR